MSDKAKTESATEEPVTIEVSGVPVQELELGSVGLAVEIIADLKKQLEEAKGNAKVWEENWNVCHDYNMVLSRQSDQIKLFMDYVKISPQYSYAYPEFIFLFNTGVRIGELAGLTWDSVDFKNNMLTIDKTVNRYRKKDFGFTMALASPKSRTSVRTIPMNNEVRKMLLKEKMRNAGPTMSIPFVDDSGNIRRQVSDIVFANSVGRVWNEPGFLNLINRIIESYNEEAEENGKEKLENFCPHMARHTYTTLAYSAGADVKAVSEILGHASTSVTIDTYAHLTEEKKRKQEEVIKTIKVL